MSIPQIDIAPFLAGDPAGRRAVVDQWAHAFETVGFATITGHGISERMLEQVHDGAAQFFDLPLAAKLKCAQPGEARSHGYVGVAVEALANTTGQSAVPAPPDLCETITFQHCDWERRGIRSAFDETIYRPNLWPDEPPGFRPLVEVYFDRVYDLAQTLMRIGALALDLPEQHFAPYYDRMSTQLRLTNYPHQTADPLPGQLRSGAHTDYLGFTILRQDDAPGGLQVQAPDGGWIDVPPVAGSFVINAGDLLSRWTNGRWKSKFTAWSTRRATSDTPRVEYRSCSSPAQITTRSSNACRRAGRPKSHRTILWCGPGITSWKRSVPAWRRASAQTPLHGPSDSRLKNTAHAMVLISCRRTPQKIRSSHLT